ncbi:type II toxin-antitoxin system PemK/MazF family toxin [Xylocopilactobacillus apis]|uniref:Type II toxin-antitoxin system PemK/MazF family toxin n=1 Tax=Xylocopilactobacillus apis TaxID=2932183 RepID=A0AAU9D473_9LACO|nr:type II toxin-antitoxin system PemK/MazF family toxin [Xylocopilactobacillus apis]BDR57140.1 hypothetical protein KIMC2_17020 [Xylocopilactobacillus apis]
MIFPNQGDLIYIDAEPHAGREEGGHNGNIRRLMVVLSNKGYNKSTGMVVGMMVTSKFKNDQRLYLPISNNQPQIKGSIITYQIPNFDYQARHGKIIGQVSQDLLSELIFRAKNIF